MVFTTANIDNVKAMVFPAGALGDGGIVPLEGLILLTWRSGETDKLFQVYLDSRLSGATLHVQQRSLLVQYDETHPVAIEIVAVPAEERDIDYSEELYGFRNTDGSHAILRWPRRGKLPLGSKANVYWDSGDGDIDYDTLLASIPIWPAPADKWGWGLDGFGKGDFGYSGTGAVGWGRGSFGQGEFGFDADMLAFQSGALTTGTYRFAVWLADERDNFDQEDIEVFEITVDPLPEAPSLAIENYDYQSDQLVLNIT